MQYWHGIWEETASPMSARYFGGIVPFWSAQIERACAQVGANKLSGRTLSSTAFGPSVAAISFLAASSAASSPAKPGVDAMANPSPSATASARSLVVIWVILSWQVGADREFD